MDVFIVLIVVMVCIGMYVKTYQIVYFKRVVYVNYTSVKLLKK